MKPHIYLTSIRTLTTGVYESWRFVIDFSVHNPNDLGENLKCK